MCSCYSSLFYFSIYNHLTTFGYSHLLRFVLCFSVAPNVTLRQCPTVVNESNDATLYCNATGNPVPSIKWIRRRTGYDTIVSNKSALMLAAIYRNESGLYQCIANNSVGNDSKNCTVDVQCKLNNYVREVV